jgi:hypothetical protein
MKTTTTNTLNLSETCPVQPDHLSGPSVNDIYGTIQPQQHAGITDPLIVADSRVRFQLMGIQYHNDEISAQQGQQLLDTRSYAPGTYSVELLNDGGRIATERLVLKP